MAAWQTSTIPADGEELRGCSSYLCHLRTRPHNTALLAGPLGNQPSPLRGPLQFGVSSIKVFSRFWNFPPSTFRSVLELLVSGKYKKLRNPCSTLTHKLGGQGPSSSGPLSQNFWASICSLGAGCNRIPLQCPWLLQALSL